MPFRSRIGLRPINRIKHVIDKQDATTANTQYVLQLATANDDPVIANTAEVLTGSTINGIFLSVQVNWESGAGLPNIYLFVAKNPGGNLTLPDANIVGTSDNKRYVIHQEMLMLTNGDDQDRTLFKGVIALPRGYRRFGPNDLLTLQIFTPGIASNVFIQSHYKEFR